jgi:murein DD-endopeptidase MepM/ murein hydrolase activator NlpD
MAGSTGNNSVNTSDGSAGAPAAGGRTSFEDMPKEMLKLFKEVEKYVERIAKNWKATVDETKKAAEDVNKDQPGSGRLGLGSFTRTEKAVGLGMGAMAVGSAYMSMAPNTMAAVTQRIGADTYAGMSGMSSRQAILQANRQVGGGATSAMGPTMAAMNLYSMGGYTANSLSSKNIMSRLGGLSAMTGMSNENAAASVAGINGMNFLRMGVKVRDSKGQLLPPEQIINQVVRATTRGGKLTTEQAAAGFLNPGGKGYNTLKAITGGDQALMATLQSGAMAYAKKGGAITAADMKDPNRMLDAMGVDKSSPLRANFRYNSSEAKKLAATEQGLVGGYDASLRTAASLNDAYSKMADILGPVNDGLMTLKGILQTFPNAGGMGGTISNIASGAGGVAAAGLQYKMMGKFLSGNPSAAGNAVTAAKAAAPALTMGSVAAGAGIAAAAGGVGYITGKGGKALGNKLGVSNGVTRAGSTLAGAGTGALTGAAIGSVVPIVGTAAGAVVGTIAGGIMGFLGSGGESGNTMDLGTAGESGSNTASKRFLPVPRATPVTSPFGPRGKAAAAAKSQGRHISSYHRGTDYGAPSGTQVTAAADGVVVEIGNQAAGWGNYITIRHADGTKTRYAHLRQIGVSRNQRIKANQVIGRSGGGPRDPGRGNSGGAHLHFEALSKSGVHVNPQSYLNSIGLPIIGAANQFRNSGHSSGGSSALFDKKDNLSSSALAELLGAGGEPISWEDVTSKYSGSKLQNLIDAVPDAYTGKPTANKKELIRTIASQGFHGKALRTAYAISIAESGGRSNAKGDVGLQTSKWGPSIGLFQIRSLKDWKKYNDPYRDASRLFDPRYNAEAAFKKSNQGKSFKAWTTYTSGSFVKHLGEADAMAKAAAVGGPTGSPVDLPHSGATAGGGRSGSASFSADSNVVINLNMPITISQASAGEAQRLVKLVADKLKTEFKTDQQLKHLGSSL